MARLWQTIKQIQGTDDVSYPKSNPLRGGLRGEHRRKHTPIVSQKQRGLFGAELSRRKRGLKGKMKGITKEELRAHLKESKGKKLPAKARKK